MHGNMTANWHNLYPKLKKKLAKPPKNWKKKLQKKKKQKNLGLNVWMHEKHEKEGFRPHTNKLKLDIVPK